MSQPSRDRARESRPRAPADRAAIVVVAGAALVAVQLAFRGWALSGGWFFQDDYSLLVESREEPLSVGRVLTPVDGRLQPAARLVAGMVEASGTLNWTLAAAATLVLQAAASAACLWMLLVLFGRRWGVLGPLCLYLFSALTLPAVLWWSAALGQVGVQLGFFVAVGAWALHLRDGRWRWAAVAVAGVATGLLFDVQAIVVVLVLAHLALVSVAGGPWRARPVRLAHRCRRAALLLVPALVGYAVLYAVQVDDPVIAPGTDELGALVETAAGRALPVALTGGPWRWGEPGVVADPSAWTVALAWVVIGVVVALSVLRRVRAGRAWVLLAACVAGSLVLLAARAPIIDASVLGLDNRSTAGVTGAAVVCLALAFLPLVGFPGSSTPRSTPLLPVHVPSRVATAATVVLVAVVSIGGLVSSVLYVDRWQNQNTSHAFMDNVATEARNHGPVEVADRTVGERLMPGLLAPDNRLERLVGLRTDAFGFPDVAADLGYLTDDGLLREVLISPDSVSRPGPEPGCGWRAADGGVAVPLDDALDDGVRWMRIGYLASQQSAVIVAAGSTTVRTEVDDGVHSLFVKVRGSLDEARLDGLEPGTSVCVDVIEVGQPTAGGTWE